MGIKLLIVIALIALLVPIAYAEEKTDNGAGITPDSVLYGLDKFFEKLELAFAGDSIKKAEIRLKLASERVAEFKVMTNKDNEDKAKAVLDDYEEEMNEAEKETENARGIGKNVSELVKTIENKRAAHLQVLQMVQTKNPDAPGLQRAIENAELKLEKSKKEQDDDNDKPDKEKPKDDKKFCTQEAKVCDDGTVVGRALPDCEFEPCPDDSEPKGKNK